MTEGTWLMVCLPLAAWLCHLFGIRAEMRWRSGGRVDDKARVAVYEWYSIAIGIAVAMVIVSLFAVLAGQ